MAIAALDLGRRRIGIAIAYDPRSHPYPSATIERRSLALDLEAIRNHLNARQVRRVIIGLPLNMDGSEGPQARIARAFASSLGHAMNVPIELFDERLTSFEAEERLNSTSPRSRRKRESIDAVAATIILEGWLQAKVGG